MSLKDLLKKKSWFMGTDQPSEEGVITSNDPKKLGYPKEISYPKKPLETTVGGDSRDWETKWYESAAKDTKKVMGPNGEEFKLKQKMQRIPMDEKIANAKLSVAFTRTAKPQDSYWTIFATDKTSGKKEEILKATLDQIWGKELGEENANITASKEYGETIIAKLRKEGFGKVSYLMTGDKSFVKTAEETAPETKEVKAQMYESELAEVKDGVDMAAGEDANRADATSEELEAKKKEIEMAETKLMELLPEHAMNIGHELQTVEEELEHAIEEEKEIAAALRDKTISASAKIKIMRVAQEAFDQAAGELLPGADEVINKVEMSAEELLHKADEVIEKVDQIVEEKMPEGEKAPEMKEEVKMEMPEEPMKEASEKKELTVAEIKNYLSKRAEMNKTAMEEEEKYGVVPEGAPKDGKDEIDRAHPKGGTEIENLTVGLPVKDKGDRFETVTEQQEHDVKVTNKMPTGELNNSVAVASVDDKAKMTKLAELIKNAEVDSATKEFWTKSLWGQSDEKGKEFGKDLVKDYETKVKASVEESKGRMKRAFELSEVAATKGMCEPTTAAKLELFNKITEFDDNAFMAFKEAVENMPTKKVFASESTLVKTASKIPVVGQKTTEDYNEFGALSKLGWS